LRLVICFLVFTVVTSPCNVQQQVKQPPATEAERLAEIERLKGVEAKLQEDLQHVRNQIDLLQREIAEEQYKLLNSFPAYTAKVATLWPRPDSSKTFDMLGYLDPGAAVEVVDFVPKGSGYFEIKYQGSVAFIPAFTVIKTPMLEDLEKRATEVAEKVKQEEEARKKEEEARQRKEDALRRQEADRIQAEQKKAAEAVAEKQRIAAEKKRKESAEARQKLLTTKYGPQIAERIMNRMYWIGMTPDMAVESLGKPREINRTGLAGGTHEQWVYSESLYLYFENGVMVSFQDKRK
jgi:Skp family chaperone for outer membrane proteins